jgi:hypothetical protein
MSQNPFSLGINRRALVSALTALPALSMLFSVPATARRAASDPLSSWNDTESKKAILAFVDRVTRRDSPDFMPRRSASPLSTMTALSGPSSRCISNSFSRSTA